MEDKVLAEKIYSVLKDKHIEKAYNCMTRLRVVVADRAALPLEEIKKIPGVLGVNLSDKELQIILGPGKATKVTQAFLTLTESSGEKQVEFGKADEVRAAIKEKNATPFKLMLRRVANIFMPLIPAFIACGLITGILNIAFKYDPALVNYPAVQIFQIAGNAVFFGLNIFVGVNTAKEFGGSPMLGGVMAIIITHPQLSQISLFDITLLPGRGGVIAVLLVVAFSSWLEKRIRKIVPTVLDLFLTPLLVIVLATFPALFLLQPLGGIIAETVGNLVTQAVNGGGVAVGFILGGTFLPLVMTGLHQGLTPIHAQLLANYGTNILLPILAMAGAGQVGASVAVYFKTKNHRLKKTIASALPVGFMGIGEPLIYGVTLPLGKPFIAACIGGAFGGAVQAFFVVGAKSMGLSGLPLATITDNIPHYLIGLTVAYLMGYLATLMIGFKDPAEE